MTQSKEVDVTNFENKMEEFKSKFGRHYTMASKKFEDAIKQIDDTIAKLMKVKENLLGSENNLRLAQQEMTGDRYLSYFCELDDSSAYSCQSLQLAH